MQEISAADRDLLPVEEARRAMLEMIEPLDSETASILTARGQALAEDVTADCDLPPFDNSAMDGYAVQSADVATATATSPIRLQVIEPIPAGRPPTLPVAAGQASRIMTGAPLPAGADGIVIVEDTDGGDRQVEVRRAITIGENIRRRGGSVRQGAVVLPRGTVIRPAEQGMLASVGCATVRVVRRPRVAVLSTGDELVEPEQTPGPGQIRDSNRFGLQGQVEAMGGLPLDIGLVPDDATLLRAAIERALATADCLITSGGVSVGDYDLTKQILGELGEIHSWRVAMKPGKPQVFGLVRGKPVFGVPGNPVSSMVVFDQFVQPALRKMAGHRELRRRQLQAIADQTMRKKPGKVHFLRVIIEARDGELHARLTGPQGSEILSSMTAANGLAIIPRDVSEVQPGEKITVELWD